MLLSTLCSICSPGGLGGFQVCICARVRERREFLPEDVPAVDLRPVHSAIHDGWNVSPEGWFQPGLQYPLPHGAYLCLQGVTSMEDDGQAQQARATRGLPNRGEVVDVSPE